MLESLVFSVFLDILFFRIKCSLSSKHPSCDISLIVVWVKLVDRNDNLHLSPDIVLGSGNYVVKSHFSACCFIISQVLFQERPCHQHVVRFLALPFQHSIFGFRHSISSSILSASFLFNCRRRGNILSPASSGCSHSLSVFFWSKLQVFCCS